MLIIDLTLLIAKRERERREIEIEEDDDPRNCSFQIKKDQSTISRSFSRSLSFSFSFVPDRKNPNPRYVIRSRSVCFRFRENNTKNDWEDEEINECKCALSLELGRHWKKMVELGFQIRACWIYIYFFDTMWHWVFAFYNSENPNFFWFELGLPLTNTPVIL